jgi:signal transduction histidine kinase
MSKPVNKSTFLKPELSVENLSIALFKANQQLADSNRQLKESERMRLELFSNLSHDLRSPLATLRSYTEYLLAYDGLDQDETIATLNQMHAKIMSIDYLINEMLLLSSLDSKEGALLSFETISIHKYLTDFFSLYKYDKRFSERNLISDLPESLSTLVQLDTNLFHRALDNIFSNALKFTKKGDSITLSAQLSDNEVIISISDTGVGIQAQHLTNIFQRSYMISDARTPGKSNDFGLGLSITSEIIEKHNGKIWCESSFGKGSTFNISIPIFVA